MSLFPIFLKLEGRQWLLVGAGTVALDKDRQPAQDRPASARRRARSPPEIRALAAEGKLEWTSAPSSRRSRRQLHRDCRNRCPRSERGGLSRSPGTRHLCNSVDDIPNCDFFFGSVVSRGELQIAISTAGESPAVAQRLRREIDEQLAAGSWRVAAQARRAAPRSARHASPRRRAQGCCCISWRSAQICDSAPGATRQFGAAGKEAGRDAAPGTVYLVGAGPGDPDLLTVKALRLIE